MKHGRRFTAATRALISNPEKNKMYRSKKECLLKAFPNIDFHYSKRPVVEYVTFLLTLRTGITILGPSKGVAVKIE